MIDSWFTVHGLGLMVQSMKRQNGISKMKSINMGDDKKEKIMEERYKVMISSSVNGFEGMLSLFEKRVEGYGYDVILSMSGKIKVNPHLGNFENCLKAVEECDVFLGIIRTDCGTGREGDSSITFDEFKRARELGKPCWFIIDNKVKYFKTLLRTLILREHPIVTDEDLREFIASYYDRKVRNREEKQLPRVLDLFNSKDFRTVDPLCLEMEDFVNHKGIPKSEVKNNLMQYCNFDKPEEIFDFIDRNIGNIQFVDDIVRGLI